MPPVASRLASLVLLAVAPLVSGCLTQDARIAESARHALLGLDEGDVRMCAGFPTRTAQIGESSEIWSYERPAGRRGGMSVVVPAFGIPGASPNVGGSLNVAPSGDCNAQFRFDDGRVVAVAYAGDNDSATGRDALCAVVVDDCLDYVSRLARRP